MDKKEYELLIFEKFTFKGCNIYRGEDRFCEVITEEDAKKVCDVLDNMRIDLIFLIEQNRYLRGERKNDKYWLEHYKDEIKFLRSMV